MIPISQRLRARLEPIGDGSGKWRPDGLCQEAADVVDALVAALERARPYVDCAVHDDGGIDNCEIEYRVDLECIDAALAKAKGKQG